MYLKLKTYIEQELQIDTEKAQIFVEQFELKNLSKGDYFLQNGSFCKKIAFINKGSMYCVYDKDGVDKVDEFSFENDFITDYLSILTQTPSDKNIICLEDCEILVTSTQKLNILYSENSIFERIGRLMAEGLFINWHLKAKSLFMEDAETRYRKLVKLRPDLPQRVPQYLIASYLNVTPETLSRIRKKNATN